MSPPIPWLARLRIALGGVREAARIEMVDRVAHAVCGGRVRGGPFAGMRYLPGLHHTSSSAKLVGAYESDLFTVVAWAQRAGFDRIVNVGAAEGYYAVGLARSVPHAQVEAFEIDARRRVELTKMAAGNAVQSRIGVHGLADPGALQAALADAPEPFVLMDIEGGERELLDAAAVPALRRSWLLIELHPGIHPDIAETLRGRFAASHDMVLIPQDPAGSGPTGGLRPAHSHWLARFAAFRRERRSSPTPWLFLRPRSSTRPFDRAAFAEAQPL
jgi:hypothetical protein